MDIPWAALSMFALAGLSVVLILIILLQRGRGGGLAGAFGGAGGQSALGTRAGDVFTKITVGLAVAWILLACVDNFILQSEAQVFEEAPGAGVTIVEGDLDDEGNPITDGVTAPVVTDPDEIEVDAGPDLPVPDDDAVNPAELSDDEAFAAPADAAIPE